MRKLQIIIAILALCGGILFAFFHPADNIWPEAAGFKYQPTKKIDVTPLSVTGPGISTEEALSTDFFEDKWTFLFVGYTYCPDICPLTLNKLVEFDNQLKEKGYHDKVRVLFVSVDPQRDTIERLKDYTAFFSPEFYAATGKDEDLEKLTSSMHMVYRVPEDKSDNNYLVDHSSSIALINPQGQLEAQLRAPHSPGLMLEALDSLM